MGGFVLFIVTTKNGVDRIAVISLSIFWPNLALISTQNICLCWLDGRQLLFFALSIKILVKVRIFFRVKQIFVLSNFVLCVYFSTAVYMMILGT